MRIRYRISRPPVDVDACAMKTLAGSMLAAVVLSLLSGCTEPTGPRTVVSRELSVKIPAYKRAAEQKDRSAASEWVRALDDDDAAVRMYAIQSLQRLTGEDLGYRFYDDKEARRPAVERWKNWLSEQKN